MAIAIRRYATRDSMVSAMQWLGNKTNYKLLSHWAGGNVKLDTDGNLLLQSDGTVEQVEIGSYIVKVGDYFYAMTEDELDETYVRIAENDEEAL